MIGLIHITPLMDELIEDLINNRDPQYYKIFREEDLKIDIAKEIIAQSYLTYEQEMLIVIAANKYNIAAQNALLKSPHSPADTPFQALQGFFHYCLQTLYMPSCYLLLKMLNPLD